MLVLGGPGIELGFYLKASGKSLEGCRGGCEITSEGLSATYAWCRVSILQEMTPLSSSLYD